MLRRVCTILCMLSLILCLAAGWFWWESYRYYRGVTYVTLDNDRYSFISDRGGLYGSSIAVSPVVMNCFGPNPGWHFLSGRQSKGLWPEEAWDVSSGQRWKPIRVLEFRNWECEIRAVAVPHWVVMVGFGVLPTVRGWRRFRRGRRRRAGCCVFCGYDLRFSAGRCPECGCAPAPATTIPHSGQRSGVARRS